MKNWKIVLLIICTFGIAYFILKKKAKEKALQTNTELTVSKKIPFHMDQFYQAVGGVQNIESSTATLNSLKLVLKKPELVNVTSLKALNAKGILKSNNSYRMTLGDFAMSLSETINQELSNQ
ncbi:PTS transporter subunit EIIB [Ureaplasma zalophigenitalium]|uniref:PTS transporter subunit EIIB n=1 Tax=Ureaplasma zalophigenitalium TaxID=907723 RepID=A0ABT3BNJ4_9BACT|nr:PTS transporter subunit EIIB [Ureaplasma zalophigenitalium]MCV3753810.1 PTS transporter subunit EIIB [Ureaplasma zalophigenitalium]